MAAPDFPTFLPMERSATPQLVFDPSGFEHVLQVDRMTHTVTQMDMPEDAIEMAIPLLQHSVAWLEMTAQAHRHHLDQLTARKRQRVNLDALIMRLPMEIIRDVLQYDADSHLVDRASVEADKTWLRLGQVCRKWRQIIFDMHTLWANDLYGFREGQGIDALLPLTREVPLNIDLVYGDGPLHISIQKHIHLIPRAWKINYDTFITNEALTLMNILSAQSLPYLQTLAFSAGTTRSGTTLPVMNLARHAHGADCKDNFRSDVF